MTRVDVQDDTGTTFRMTMWKFLDTGVKIQDIHDDRVKVPGHRGEDSGDSR